jgi:uncharacterized membrane protein YfbV (UPF0208 family)
MFIVWLFWLFVLAGGLYMGGQALRALVTAGFDLGIALNALVWLGCGLAALPRIWKIATSPKAPAAH